MVCRATTIIDSYFTQEGVKHRLEGTDTQSRIICGVQGKDDRIAQVLFISTGDTLDVAVRVFNFNQLKCDGMNRRAVLRACNQLNNRFRFAKFLIDKDDTVNVEYDLPQEASEDSLGPMCKEIFYRLMSIMDEAYKVFDEITLM